MSLQAFSNPTAAMDVLNLDDPYYSLSAPIFGQFAAANFYLLARLMDYFLIKFSAINNL